jgi:DNA helicase-2/ATP-dependent DNA helicase PcrA
MLYGRTNAAMASRFLREIPDDVTVKKGGFQRPSDYSVGYSRPVQPSYKPVYHTPAAAAPQSLELNKGDMVEHTAFGRGLVLSVLKMSGDALLEIAFDKVGTKKLMAKAASAHMKKL